MRDYDQMVQQMFKPKVSQRKKDELEMAFKNKSSPFARQDPHLPMHGMLKDMNGSPISPHFNKEQLQKLSENISPEKHKKNTEKDKNITSDKKRISIVILKTLYI